MPKREESVGRCPICFIRVRLDAEGKISEHRFHGEHACKGAGKEPMKGWDGKKAIA